MKRTRRPKWSFMVIRGADQAVKQFQISKRAAVAAPAAAVLAVTGWIAGVHIHSAQETGQLEGQLAAQSDHYLQTVEEKDKAIAVLQQELVRLSQDAQEVRTKVNDLQELEMKLRQFIEQYGSRASPDAASRPLPAREPGVRPLSAFPSPSPDTGRLAAMARGSSVNLRSLSSMVDTMGVSMAQTLRIAQQTRAEADAVPSTWPTRSIRITSGFGYRKDPFTGKANFHAGIDISGKTGDPVFSAADGLITGTGYNSSQGNFVVIDHHNGLKSVYMHLNRIEAAEGDTVVRGEKIGLLGSSGRSSGPHLHFQIMQTGEAVDPLRYLQLSEEE